MKKGFTLIELLAVILILGIIALIAIPTVNKIIKEAREGAFKTSNNNIIKAVEQNCQLSLIKGEIPKKNYIFNDKNEIELEIKGELPNDGYITLDNECKVIDYYFANDNIIYAMNKEKNINNHMIMSYTDLDVAQSIFKTLYPSQFNTIKTVSILKSNTIPENAINIQDISKLKNNNINSYVLEREDSGYDLYIISNETIYTNYDSSYLFYDFSSVISYDLSNLDTSFSHNLSYLFGNNKSLTTINISNLNTENAINLKRMFSYGNSLVEIIGIDKLITDSVKDMECMFVDCKSLLSLDLVKWRTSNLQRPFGMFYGCNSLINLNVSSWDVKNVITMEKMFWECLSLEQLDLSKWITSEKLTSLTHAFVRCQSLIELNVKGFNIKNVTHMTATFTGCVSLKKIIGIENWDTSNVIHQYDGGVSGIFTACKVLEELNLSGWKMTNINNMSYLFSTCDNLKSINISNFDIKEGIAVSNIFTSSTGLNYVKVLNAKTINIIDDYLPTHSSSSPGTIVIIGDTSNLDITILESKYWNIIDGNGNPINSI